MNTGSYEYSQLKKLKPKRKYLSPSMDEVVKNLQQELRNSMPWRREVTYLETTDYLSSLLRKKKVVIRKKNKREVELNLEW